MGFGTRLRHKLLITLKRTPSESTAPPAATGDDCGGRADRQGTFLHGGGAPRAPAGGSPPTRSSTAAARAHHSISPRATPNAPSPREPGALRTSHSEPLSDSSCAHARWVRSASSNRRGSDSSSGDRRGSGGGSGDRCGGGGGSGDRCGDGGGSGGGGRRPSPPVRGSNSSMESGETEVPTPALSRGAQPVTAPPPVRLSHSWAGSSAALHALPATSGDGLPQEWAPASLPSLPSRPSRSWASDDADGRRGGGDGDSGGPPPPTARRLLSGGAPPPRPSASWAGTVVRAADGGRFPARGTPVDVRLVRLPSALVKLPSTQTAALEAAAGASLPSLFGQSWGGGGGLIKVPSLPSLASVMAGPAATGGGGDGPSGHGTRLSDGGAPPAACARTAAPCSCARCLLAPVCCDEDERLLPLYRERRPRPTAPASPPRASHPRLSEQASGGDEPPDVTRRHTHRCTAQCAEGGAGDGPFGARRVPPALPGGAASQGPPAASCEAAAATADTDRWGLAEAIARSLPSDGSEYAIDGEAAEVARQQSARGVMLAAG